MAYRFDVYQAKDGYRWRCVAPNGEIVADSAEAYATRSNAERAIASLRAETPDNGVPDPHYVEPAGDESQA